MFGSHEFGSTVTFASVVIETYKDEGLFVYHRKSDREVTKILSPFSTLMINPIEPVTQPKEITHYLLIELKKPLLISPENILNFYVTFPIEIGVYVSVEEDVEIDFFTLTTPKYTLYGSSDRGVVCKWWQSDIHSTIPEVDPYKEGVMKVNIHSNAKEWVELKKMVFDAYAMKIYYSTFACMNASVEVLHRDSAKTSFVEEPILPEMKEALELFRLRKIPMVERREFLMEWGL